MAASAKLIENIGKTVKKVVGNKGSSWWYTPHMAAASRAIADRVPLVDFVVEVRDARIPWSSAFGELNFFLNSSKHIIVLNKTDLANHKQTKKWMGYLKDHNYVSCEINSHNEDSIKRLLNLLQSEVEKLERNGQSNNPTTVMLVGIPNCGKSALANSLHQIGRISAAEKGKLRHATVSPHPGETKKISSFKIASHPSIYVLDTPGILPPDILDDEVCSKLALTGALADCLVGELELAQYFLAIHSMSDEYKRKGKLSIYTNILPGDQQRKRSTVSKVVMGPKKQVSDHRQRKRSTVSKVVMGPKKQVSDHRQDLEVECVRQTLFETIASFKEDLGDDANFAKLFNLQLVGLHKAFQVVPGIGVDAYYRIGKKLLDLFRAGKLGYHTLDQLSSDVK